MRNVQIDRSLTSYAGLFLIDNAMNRACRNVSRHEISILRIPLLKKIEALSLGNTLRWACVCRIPWHPYAAALAAGRFAHQPKLVFAGNRRGMDLNELAICVVDSLLEQGRLRRAGAHYRICRTPKN